MADFREAAELSARRKADRAEMARQVAVLAVSYGLAAEVRPEQEGSRVAAVELAGPHGLRLTVQFDGRPARLATADTYVLSWHGVEDDTRLHPGMFGHVNGAHGGKATDVAHGFGQLLRILRERLTVIVSREAFVTA